MIKILEKIQLIRVSLNGYDDESFKMVQKPGKNTQSFKERMDSLNSLIHYINNNKPNTIVGWHFTIDEINLKGIEKVILLAEKLHLNYLQFSYDKYLANKVKKMSKIVSLIDNISGKVKIPIANIKINQTSLSKHLPFCWFKYKPNIYPDGSVYICPLMNKDNSWSYIGKARNNFYQTWTDNFKSKVKITVDQCNNCPFNQFNNIYNWLYDKYVNKQYQSLYKVMVKNEIIETVFQKRNF